MPHPVASKLLPYLPQAWECLNPAQSASRVFLPEPLLPWLTLLCFQFNTVEPGNLIDGALQAGGIAGGKKLLRCHPFLFVRLGPGGHVRIYVHCTIL